MSAGGVTAGGVSAGGVTAAQRWAASLSGWAIPEPILAQAPVSPWIHPVELFRVSEGAVPDSPSHTRAREAIPPGGSVLDVGCGGGRAAFAVAPPATVVTGVDQQPSMLAEFAATAATRGLRHREISGAWPEVAPTAPLADVVVCHHVAYNVADLAAFALALQAHAAHRVVLELSGHHPLATMRPFWREFWDLERPDGPTAADAAAVLREAGLPARLQEWDAPAVASHAQTLPRDRQVQLLRIRLCLPPERDPDIAAALDRAGPVGPRRLATLWWDTAPALRRDDQAT